MVHCQLSIVNAVQWTIDNGPSRICFVIRSFVIRHSNFVIRDSPAFPSPQGGAYHWAMSPGRLYMDNAATSFPKPLAVTDAMVRYARELGAMPGGGRMPRRLKPAL